MNLTLALAAFAGFTASAYAQDIEALRRRWMIAVPSAAAAAGVATSGFFRGAPGTNSGTPLAFGPNWGDAFVGGGYQNTTRGVMLANGTLTANGNNDGSISAGFGVGNSKDAVGLEVVVTSLSTFRSGVGKLTAYSFKVHRMLDNTSAVALGVENAFTAGAGTPDGTDSWYAVASKVWVLPKSNGGGLLKAVTVSGGIGNGRFRTIDDVRQDNKTVNVFASGSLLIHEQLSAIVDYTGQDVNVGVSIVPLQQFPLVITPALADLTGAASKTPRLILGVGIGMHF
ncbi:MAG TPA: hypothetical protein VJL28_08190 [Gemmatimonadaceae bacterium]|nr:hypothetical protein [Gemmatimonadaceae bacterium]